MAEKITDQQTQDRLKEHSVRIREMEILTAKIQWLREYFDSKIQGIEEKTELARQSMEKRLDGMNEIKGAMKDQLATHPTRTEVEIKIEAIEKELKTLNSFKDTVSGKADQSDVGSAKLIAFIGVGLGILSFILNLLGVP